MSLFSGEVVLNCKRNYDLVHIYILFIFMNGLECFPAIPSLWIIVCMAVDIKLVHVSLRYGF